MNWDFKTLFAGRRQETPQPSGNYTIKTSLMDVTIREFMRCLFKSEYEILTISGTPPRKALCDTWDNLYEDYAKAIGNQQYQRLMRAMREYIRLTGKLMSAEAGLTILQMRRDEEAIDVFETTRAEWKPKTLPAKVAP